MLHLYAALAEKERRLIAERSKAALGAKRAAGARLGNTANLRLAGSMGNFEETPGRRIVALGLHCKMSIHKRRYSQRGYGYGPS